MSSPPAAHLGAGGARNAAALPYASRVRDDSSELHGGGGGGGSKRSSRDGLNPSGAGAKARKSVRHHSSTKEGDGHRGAGGGSRRKRKKKPLKWWQKRSTLLATLVALILVVGLAVGLGVGLTVGKDDDDSGSSNSSRDGVAPTASTGGVQPSASGIGGPDVPVSASGETGGSATATQGDGDIGALTVQPTAIGRESNAAVRAAGEAMATRAAPTPAIAKRRLARWA